MNSTLNSVVENSPVSQEGLLSEVEIWEPPFERWIRLADALLGKVPALPRATRATPQSLVVPSRS